MVAIFGLILCASCKKIGDVRTVDVAGDAQGTPSIPANVTLTMSAGELHVTPGGAHTVGGSVRSNVKDLESVSETSAVCRAAEAAMSGR